MDRNDTSAFQKRLAEMEASIAAVDAIADQQIREKSRELVRNLLDLHGSGVERALAIIFESNLSGQALIDRLAQDEVVSPLLILHGLHPLDLEARVRNAIDSVKPRLGLHGGSVDVVGVTPEGTVKLRLQGNCHGCPSSRITLKSSIEEAIYAAAPDIIALEVEGAVDNFVDAPNGAQPKFTECPT